MKLFDCSLSHFVTWPSLPPLKINSGTFLAKQNANKSWDLYSDRNHATVSRKQTVLPAEHRCKNCWSEITIKESLKDIVEQCFYSESQMTVKLTVGQCLCSALVLECCLTARWVVLPDDQVTPTVCSWETKEIKMCHFSLVVPFI